VFLINKSEMNSHLCNGSMAKTISEPITFGHMSTVPTDRNV
jgi:hypothetical protein